jgi:uncharacterized protein YbaR (Trm112 family)/2-polyprenyl-3-methyl-5-hydroxy-6-metoxy-1,4-benzoquinol methylase
MRSRLTDLLVCPIDKHKLELLAWDTVRVSPSPAEAARIEAVGLSPERFTEEIVTGVLVNHERKVFYPIYRGVPRMLVFPTGVSRRFVQENAGRLRGELPGYTLPAQPPMPGEEDTLRSFSREWVSYDWNPRAYWGVTPEVMYRCMRFLLDLDRQPVRHQLVLEVGIGIGGIADYVSRSENCELCGVDLSYAVDAAYKNFGRNPLLHILQASVFALPFPDRRFDFVYSQGVIMCTHSTKAAFDHLAVLPRPGGRLYIWVYSHYDEERTLERRGLMALEKVVRPIVWRLPEFLQTAALTPFVPLYILRQRLVAGRDPSVHVTYGWREAMHAARDRFTPRFVYRHSEDEVRGWFEQAEYVDVQTASERTPPADIPASFVTATAVDGRLPRRSGPDGAAGLS